MPYEWRAAPLSVMSVPSMSKRTRRRGMGGESLRDTLRAAHEAVLAPRPFPHRFHRLDRLRDGDPVLIVLRPRVRGERDDGRGGGRDLLDHAVLLRADQGTRLGPDRPPPGD